MITKCSTIAAICILPDSVFENYSRDLSAILWLSCLYHPWHFLSVALHYHNGQAAARDQSYGRGELSLSESSLLCFYVFFCILC